MRFASVLHFRPIRAIRRFAWDRAMRAFSHERHYAFQHQRQLFHFWCGLHHLLNPDRYSWPRSDGLPGKGDTHDPN